MVNLLNEGSVSTERPGSSEGKSATNSMASSEGAKLTISQHSGSQEPLVQHGSDTIASHPPGIPTLETADGPREAEVTEKSGEKREEGGEDEDGGGYACVKKEYDYVDKTAGDGRENAEDEAGYAYATVGGAIGEGPAGPAKPPSEGVGGGEGGRDDKQKGSGLPPYGKVTRHMVPVAKKSGYSEVLTSSPMLPPGRPRAVTEPVDPVQADSHKREGQGRGLRDERAFTESAAHLPLPQIPKLDVSDETYDSIPDELRDSASTPAGGTSDKPSGAAAKPHDAPVRESLYESVEMDEAGNVEIMDDTYESVPDDMKTKVAPASSPDTLSPSSPFPPPPRSPIINRTKTEGVISTTPPASPLLKERTEDDGKKRGKDHAGKGDQKKHKALSKAKSDTGTDAGRGRSLSSLFSRKKPSATAASNTPSSPKTKKQHEPLPKVPTTGAVPSPTHLHPHSPPPMPAPLPPSEEEDDYPSDGAYDMIDVLNPRGAALLKNSNTAKAKSASLPSSMRSAGPSMMHGHGPLPELPEESAGGLVARQRVAEDMDPEYDTVVLGQVMDDPSYDSVEVGGGGDAMPKLEPAEPPSSPPPPVAPEGEGDQTPANKYARVSSHAAVVDSTFSPPDLTAHAPEHDELGYAVIPAHLKMRKRAMSDAMAKKVEERKKSRPKSVEMTEDIPVSSGEAGGAGDDTLRVPTPPMEPEYESVTDAMKDMSETAPTTGAKKETPYASVDLAAKRMSQMLKQQSGSTSDADDALMREASPNPPPVPQQGDLGDLSEFERPPVPLQAKDSLELIDPSELQPPATGVTNPYSQIDLLPNDPPYASVKKKSQDQQTAVEENEGDAGNEGEEEEEENPYSIVLDNSEGIVASTGGNDPPYAKVQKGKVVGDEPKGEQNLGPGYAKAGSKRLAEDGSFEPTNDDAGTTNGTHSTDNGEEEEEDTYDRLDHGFGGSASCRGRLPTSPAPDGEGEYSTVTVDFSTSPELVVTHTDSVRHEENGVIRQVEETTINFTD